MKTRLITALVVGTIAAGVYVGVAIWQGVDQKFGIALATGLIGFFLGLVFKFRAI